MTDPLANSGFSLSRPPWRRATARFVSRVQAHVAGKPALRRGAGRVLKSLGAAVGYAALVEPHWIAMTHIEIDVPGLPLCLDGYRIVHLTDVHHNVVAGRRFLERVVEKSNALDADVIALTGDFVTHNADRMEECLGILSHLCAPDGLYATRGNHDFGLSLDRMRSMCWREGIVLLENEHAVIEPRRHRVARANGVARPKAQIVLGGVSDLWKGHPDPQRAFAGAPLDAPRILLSHNPQVGELVTAGQRVALQLSGHTHGGQVRPFQRPLSMFADGSMKYASGLVAAPHTTVFVSRGVGTSAFRVRWNCRPEIALVTLRCVDY